MSSCDREQFLTFPITHAMGLVLWTLLVRDATFECLAWWCIWPPTIRVLFDLRITLLVLAGSAPFLGVTLWNLLR